MIANSGPQLLIVAGAIVASISPSAVSWLYFANRLIELPLGMVGVAMGTVLVPEMTRALNKGDSARAGQCRVARDLNWQRLSLLPATLGLIILSEPIVRVLFEHGAFTAADTRATALALGCLAPRPARPCPDQGAVSGLLRARQYHDAAYGGAEGNCGRDRSRASYSDGYSGPAESPPLSRSAHGAMQSAWSGASPRRSDFPSMPKRGGGCRALSWLRC